MGVPTRSTGFPDSRFLHRGSLEPGSAERAAADPESPAGRVLRGLGAILEARARIPGLAAAPPPFPPPNRCSWPNARVRAGHEF
jgi:hypothetical protein